MTDDSLAEAAPAATGAPAAAPEATAGDPSGPAAEPPRKGPMSFLSGSLTSLLLGWICLGLSRQVLGYYADHPPHYTAPIAQSIGTAVKTLVVGTTFLATFCFSFVGLGLFLVFLRSLGPGAAQAAAAAGPAAQADSPGSDREAAGG